MATVRVEISAQADTALFDENNVGVTIGASLLQCFDRKLSFSQSIVDDYGREPRHVSGFGKLGQLSNDLVYGLVQAMIKINKVSAGPEFGTQLLSGPGCSRSMARI